MEAELFDGTILEFPDGTDPNVISSTVKRITQERRAAPQETLPALKLHETVKTPTIGERVAGTELARFGMGALGIPIAMLQASANVGPRPSGNMDISGALGKIDGLRDPFKPPLDINKLLKDWETTKRRGMSFYSGNPVGEDWDVSGGLGAIAGGTLALKAAALPDAATRIGRYIQGAGSGGMLASLMPDTEANSPEEYASNLASRAKMGAALGFAFPVGVDLAKGAYNIGKSSVGALSDTFKNFSQKGQQRLAEEHLRTLAEFGGKEKTLSALKDASKLTGRPTSAEAIAQANIGAGERFGGPLVRLQHELAALPETSTKLRSIEVSQEAARLEKLGKIAGDEAQKSAAKAAADRAGQAYERIAANPVRSNKTLEWMMGTKAFKEAEARAAGISENLNAAALARGEAPIPFKIMVDVVGKDGKVTRTAQYSAQGLQHIKQVLDEFAETPTIKSSTGILGTEGVGYKALSKSLVGWMDNNIEGWKPARQNYKAAMTVLNRQAGGKVLQDTLSGPRGEERVVSFLQAQRDLPKTLKPVSGKIRPVPFTPEEQAIIDDVAGQLRRDAQVTRMAGELNIPGATSPVTGNIAQLPSPLYRPTMIANWILRRGGDEGNREVNRIAADILADPARAAEVLGKLPSPMRRAVMDTMTRLGKFAYKPAFVGATALPAQEQNQ